jgi:hypothetical protein
VAKFSWSTGVGAPFAFLLEEKNGDSQPDFYRYRYFKTREDDPQYREYSFGELGDFIENHESRYPGIKANYSELRQDFYQVEGKDCFLCPGVETCRVCPINVAYSTGSLGKISCQKCALIKIEKNTRNRLLK